jgi:hypothetical protein
MQMSAAEKENEKKQRLERQIGALRSGNRTAILEALREIRSESSTSILPELFDLLLDQEDEEIKRETASLLNDLKSAEAGQVLAEAIARPEYRPIAAILVAACWQNGLPYGEYAETFADIAVKGDYQTAIEAFTVLEEAVGELDAKERKKISDRIRHGLRESSGDKTLLLRELIKVIESY